MNKTLFAAALVGLTAGNIATSANAATYTYVGSWQVDSGPSWTTVPTAYTGQAAAALLFGGSASSYVISTIDSNPVNIDFMAWVSVWGAAGFPDCAGFPCGRKVAQDVVTSTGGLYANPGDESAFVNDWAGGDEFTNYAFSLVPEPASWAMLIAGFGLVGAVARRRRQVATAA